jgi:hypothetical protein
MSNCADFLKDEVETSNINCLVKGMHEVFPFYCEESSPLPLMTGCSDAESDRATAAEAEGP